MPLRGVEGSAVLRRSHKGTGLAPLVWTADESKEVWLCQCKQTKKAPYCDGTHKSV